VTVQRAESITVFLAPISIHNNSPLAFMVGTSSNFDLRTITSGGAPPTSNRSYSDLDGGPMTTGFGLAVNGSVGTITGNPAAAGSFDIALTARSQTDPGSITQTITITVLPAVTPPQITTARLPIGEKNAAYSSQLQTNPSSTSLTFADLGTPNGCATPSQLGLALNTASGAITSGQLIDITRNQYCVGYSFQGTILWAISVTDAQTSLSSTAYVELSIVDEFRMNPSINNIVNHMKSVPEHIQRRQLVAGPLEDPVQAQLARPRTATGSGGPPGAGAVSTAGAASTALHRGAGAGIGVVAASY